MPTGVAAVSVSLAVTWLVACGVHLALFCSLMLVDMVVSSVDDSALAGESARGSAAELPCFTPWLRPPFNRVGNSGVEFKVVSDSLSEDATSTKTALRSASAAGLL